MGKEKREKRQKEWEEKKEEFQKKRKAEGVNEEKQKKRKSGGEDGKGLKKTFVEYEDSSSEDESWNGGMWMYAGTRKELEEVDEEIKEDALEELKKEDLIDEEVKKEDLVDEKVRKEEVVGNYMTNNESETYETEEISGAIAGYTIISGEVESDEEIMASLECVVGEYAEDMEEKPFEDLVSLPDASETITNLGQIMNVPNENAESSDEGPDEVKTIKSFENLVEDDNALPPIPGVSNTDVNPKKARKRSKKKAQDSSAVGDVLPESIEKLNTSPDTAIKKKVVAPTPKVIKTHVFDQRMRPPTLLERLLLDEIKKERNKRLQCVRFVCKNNFFDPSEK